MTVAELVKQLSALPSDAYVEVCVNNTILDDHGADYEAVSVTPVSGTDEWVTINLGDFICDHG